MSNSESDSNREKLETSLNLRLQLSLIANILNMIASVLGTIVALEAIEEAKIAEQYESEKQKELTDILKQSQNQIEKLWHEIDQIKSMIGMK